MGRRGCLHYTKLREEAETPLFSFTCTNCGHLQTLQAEEVNTIVGNAFRMAYAGQLGAEGRLRLQLHSHSGFQPASNFQDTEPQPIVWPKAIAMRREEVGVDGTPSSEESNSPTELNSAKRLGEKPPMEKRLALGTTPSRELPPPIILPSTPKATPDRPPHRSESEVEGKVQGPPAPPQRTDSLTDRTEEELKTAPWFQAGIPREITLEVLGEEPVGSFMVRESTTKPGCYALSLRVPHEFQPLGIAHYLIIRTNKGYKIKGFTKEFSSLTALITHHSVMPELLPVPLSLHRYNPIFDKSDSSRDFADIDSDPDYNTLADFRKMMADMNV